jgi:hypothetical protein
MGKKLNCLKERERETEEGKMWEGKKMHDMGRGFKNLQSLVMSKKKSQGREWLFGLLEVVVANKHDG